jgi:hypothetical protein
MAYYLGVAMTCKGSAVRVCVFLPVLQIKQSAALGMLIYSPTCRDDFETPAGSSLQGFFYLSAVGISSKIACASVKLLARYRCLIDCYILTLNTSTFFCPAVRRRDLSKHEKRP